MNEVFTRRAFSAAAFCVPLVVYIWSLTPSVGFWDTGEMQTVPYIFGIAHPTGFPLFILLGYVFSHAVAIFSVAWRMSLMSAIAMAGAAWLVFLASRDEGVDDLIACLCAWTFAFGVVAWTRGTRAEVHALAILLIGATIWAALRARATGSTQPLYAAALCMGLAAATHPVMIWAIPGVLILLFLPPARAKRFPARAMLTALLLVLAPLLLYFYMPLRSAYVAAHTLDPTQALGLPPSQAFWNWGHPADWHGFLRAVLGSYYAKWDALIAIFRPSLYPSMAQEFGAKIYAEFSVIAIALMLLGMLAVIVKDVFKALGLMLIVVAGVPFALSYAIETDFDRYFLTAYWVLALFTGYGAQAVMTFLKARLRIAAVALGVAALLLFFSVGYTFAANRATFAQNADHTGDAFIDRALRETPDRSIIVASWIYATPLAYASYVEHRLGGRVIVSAEPDEIAEYVKRWQRNRPVYVIYFKPFGDRVFSLDGMRLEPTGGESPAIYRVVPAPHHP